MCQSAWLRMWIWIHDMWSFLFTHQQLLIHLIISCFTFFRWIMRTLSLIYVLFSHKHERTNAFPISSSRAQVILFHPLRFFHPIPLFVSVDCFHLLSFSSLKGKRPVPALCCDVCSKSLCDIYCFLSRWILWYLFSLSDSWSKQKIHANEPEQTRSVLSAVDLSIWYDFLIFMRSFNCFKDVGSYKYYKA